MMTRSATRLESPEGPTSAEVESRRAANVARGVRSLSSICVERASGSEVWDVGGNRFIDFTAGIGVLNVGHGHPEVEAALGDQLKRLIHSCFHVAAYEPYVVLAERLNALAPTGRANKTMLVTTGAEAVENAIKIARVATGRPGIIAFSGAFHGRTSLGMALTGKVAPYKTGFGPFPPEIYHVPFPDARDANGDRSIAAIEELFAADIDQSRVAAVIVEPVQGEGGFNIAPPAFLRALRRLCDTHGILLIADEIQSGFARTGRMFAIEHADTRADLVTMAKSLAGGMPLSAVVGAAEIMDAVPPGGLGGTYAGNPLACVAALAVIDIIQEEDLCARAIEVGDRIRSTLGRLAAADPRIGDVRGLGAMIAVDLVSGDTERRPNAELAQRLVAACAERGLLVLTCGKYGNVVRFLPPLTIGMDVLDEGLGRFCDALQSTRS